MGHAELLFATPNFLGGMASVMDLGSTLTIYNESPTAEIADHNAISMDWLAVGEDLRYAMNRFENIENGQT